MPHQSVLNHNFSGRSSGKKKRVYFWEVWIVEFKVIEFRKSLFYVGKIDVSRYFTSRKKLEIC